MKPPRRFTTWVDDGPATTYATPLDVPDNVVLAMRMARDGGADNKAIAELFTVPLEWVPVLLENPGHA